MSDDRFDGAPDDAPDDAAAVSGEELILAPVNASDPPDLLQRMADAIKADAPGAVRNSASWWRGRARQEDGKGAQEEAKARLVLAQVREQVAATGRADARLKIEQEAADREAARADARMRVEQTQADAQKIAAQAQLLQALAAAAAAGVSIDVGVIARALPLSAGNPGGH